MTHSMTAFAQASIKTEIGDLSCELRSVNHRFLDIAPRMPEEFRVFEADLRAQISKRLHRGRVDCFICFNEKVEKKLSLNTAAVQQLQRIAQAVQSQIADVEPMRIMDILKWQGVLEDPTWPEEQLKQCLMAVVDKAVNSLVQSRKQEGEKMAQLVLQRCDAMQEIVQQVPLFLTEINQHFKQRIEDKLEELQHSLDQERVEQELVLFLHKSDISEELERLIVHIQEVRKVLAGTEPCGRKLDFLMQELNREANTLGSKSHDIRLTKASVDMKVLIEQMREQVQNIE